MKVSTRIVGFVVGLALVFGASFGIARLFSDDAQTPSAGPFTLKLANAVLHPGESVPLAFTILDSDKQTLTAFDVRHEKRLHLILVNTHFGGFQHVHPVMAADGTWSVGVALDTGTWRVYADFKPRGGANAVAPADLTVDGAFPPMGDDGDGPGLTTVSSVGDVSVKVVGSLTAGAAGSVLNFDVSDVAGPITDLQPYLGSYGHLVVLRDSDMQYLHVHPEEGPAGPRIPFHVVVPTPGIYHLYLDFKRGGVVRTVTFLLKATAAAPGDEHTGDMGDMPGMGHGDH